MGAYINGDYKSEYSGDQIDAAIGKVRNPDSTPTASSDNLVTSGGVKAALDTKQAVINDLSTIRQGASDGSSALAATNEIEQLMDQGYKYYGVATPSTNPGTLEQKVFYIASQAGTYTNLGGIVVNDGEVCTLMWNEVSWVKQVTGAATAAQVSQLGPKYGGINAGLFQANWGKLWSSGELTPGDDFTSTDLLPVSEKIIVNFYDGGTTYPSYGLMFFDENKSYIGRYSSGQPGAYRTVALSKSDMPNGTEYFAVSTNKERIDNAFIIGVDATLFEQVEKDVSSQIASVSEAIDEVDDKIGEILSFTGTTEYNRGKTFDYPLKQGKQYRVVFTAIDAEPFYIGVFPEGDVDSIVYIEKLYDKKIITPLADGNLRIYNSSSDHLTKTYAFSIVEVGTISDKLETNENKGPILFHQTGVNNFSIKIYNPGNGKFIEHPFIHTSYSYDMSQYGGASNVLCGDLWNPQDIKDDNGLVLMAGNLNFIYMVNSAVPGFENENLHVGMGGGVSGGHGLEVMEWTKIFADGKELNLSAINQDVKCSTFRIVYKSKCLAPDSSISSTNTNNYPKIVNGQPIVTAEHFMDATFYSDNTIKWRHRLIFLRDNIQFMQLHGAMLAWKIAILDRVIINDNKASQCQYSSDGVTPASFTETLVGDSNPINGHTYRGDEAVAFGNGYIVRQRIIQDDGTRFYKSWINGGNNANPTEMKLYFDPADIVGVVTTPEVFNNGDEISVTVERKIETIN